MLVISHVMLLRFMACLSHPEARRTGVLFPYQVQGTGGLDSIEVLRNHARRGFECTSAPLEPNCSSYTKLCKRSGFHLKLKPTPPDPTPWVINLMIEIP